MSRSAPRRPENEPAQQRRGRIKVVAVVLLLVAIFVLGRLVEVDDYLKTVQKWIWGFGWWGPAIYVVLFVAATLLFIPATPLTVLSPFLFGIGPGYLTVTAATTAASVAGFLIARTFGRGAAERMLGETEAFRRIRAMVEKNRRIAIPFIRLVPMLPFAMNDYALGLTRIPFWSYLFWSQLVFLPMNAVLVLGAGAIYAAVIRGEASWWLIGVSAGAALLVLGGGYLVKRIGGPGMAGGE